MGSRATGYSWFEANLLNSGHRRDLGSRRVRRGARGLRLAAARTEATGRGRELVAAQGLAARSLAGLGERPRCRWRGGGRVPARGAARTARPWAPGRGGGDLGAHDARRSGDLPARTALAVAQVEDVVQCGARVGGPAEPH